MFILDRLVDKIERFAEVVSILPSRFPDPATQYAYFLFDFHDSIMSYIFFILILVYWVLLKIIQDYTWLLYKNFFKNIAIFYYIRVIIEYIIYNLTSFLGSRAWLFYNFIEAYRAYIIVTKRFRYFVPKRIREYFYPEFLYSNWPTLGSNFYTYLWKAFVSLCIITLIPFALVPIVLRGYQYRNKFIRYQLFVRRTSTRNIMNIYRLPLFKNESKYLFYNRYWRIYRQNYFSLRKVKSLLLTSFIDTINYHYMTNSYFYNNYIHINKLHEYQSKYSYPTSSLCIDEILSIRTEGKKNWIFDIKDDVDLDDNNSITPQWWGSKLYVRNEYLLFIKAFFSNQGFRHSTKFELIWAAFPTIIITMILIPSLYLLYSLDEELDPYYTIKVIGHQWYWEYEFNNWVEMDKDSFNYVEFKFDSYMVPTDDLNSGDHRLLEVDKRLIVPIDVPLRFIITSNDVLHSWAVPRLGIKSDATPGRLAQFLGYISYPGVFYGQCSELCGSAHAFMPIVVQAVPNKNFLVWLKESNLI